jgi:hypothetical protein
MEEYDTNDVIICNFDLVYRLWRVVVCDLETSREEAEAR